MSLTAEQHVVVKTQKRGRVHTVVCACGDKFQSINDVSWANSYHTSHRLAIREANAKRK